MHHRPRQRRRGPSSTGHPRNSSPHDGKCHARARPRASFDSADGRHLCTPKLHIEPAPGSAADPYRSQAARRAACSSRVTLGDLAGLPLLMNAPCPHCEQISTRGSDAAVAAPICPQLGQTIRVSMSVTTAAAGAAARGQALRSSSGSLAMLAAMRRASHAHWLAVSRLHVGPDVGDWSAPSVMAALAGDRQAASGREHQCTYRTINKGAFICCLRYLRAPRAYPIAALSGCK